MRKLVVTTPIFYVNGPPHLGHASSVLLADACARWLRMLGREVLFSTGTDEHGGKVEKAAKTRGVDVGTFCDAVSREFENLATALGSSHDVFVRTTSAEHRDTVVKVWEKLRERGCVEQGSYSGYYSASDESFVPEQRTTRVNGVRVSGESGHPVEWLEENTYRLNVQTFSETIRSWAATPGSIVPHERAAEVAAQCDDILVAPLSISRLRARTAWGIPVPGDHTHVRGFFIIITIFFNIYIFFRQFTCGWMRWRII
jgi:methionyl-tRNA synthetase